MPSPIKSARPDFITKLRNLPPSRWALILCGAFFTWLLIRSPTELRQPAATPAQQPTANNDSTQGATPPDTAGPVPTTPSGTPNSTTSTAPTPATTPQPPVAH